MFRNNIRRKLVGWFCGLTVLFVTLNIIVLPEEVVADSGPGWVNLDELGFSAEFVDTLSSILYCPRFIQNNDWETLISLCNPSDYDTNVDVTYYDVDGDYIDDVELYIESEHTIDFISTDHSIQDDVGSIVITSDVAIFGNVIYYGEYCAASEPLQQSPSTTLYCPGFYQTDNWDTWICINNIDSSSNSITITYYDEDGDVIDTVIELLSSNEIRYFRPSDDDVVDTLGSIVIDSNTPNGITGYAFKINTVETIAYSYSLKDDLKTKHSTTFVTTDDNTNEIVFFNPEQQSKSLELTFYNYNGTQIDYVSEYPISSFSTTRIIINQYIDYDCYGWVKIESNYDGVVGYYGYIDTNYGFANSIEMSTEEQFYASCKNYKEDDMEIYPYIGYANPSNQNKYAVMPVYDNNPDNNSEANGTLVANGAINNAEDTGFFGWEDLQYQSPPDDSYLIVKPEEESGGFQHFNPWYAMPPDADGDGLSDMLEMMTNSNTGLSVGDPYDSDTDNDGLPDGWEYYKLGASAVRDNSGANGANGDPDGDGLKNSEEYQSGTHPKKSDTDYDGLSDYAEINTHGTSPTYRDTDHDELSDGAEINLVNTDPLDEDTDNDGILDGKEDTDNDGRNDGFETDNNLDFQEGNIEWTIMVYMAADNDLEWFAIDDLNEMENIGCTDDITLIVQIDRSNMYDKSNDDWTSTRRYLIGKDSNTNKIGSYLLQNMGELNMGSQTTLNNFQSWGREDFPADKYVIILWDHGGGWTYCCEDENPYDKLGIDEIKGALPDNRQFDIIVFEACLMGTTEVFYQIYEKADIAIGSEEKIPADGLPYDKILSDLDNNPEMSSSDLAKKIVNNYYDSFTDGKPDPYDDDIVTLSAVDLDKFKKQGDCTVYWINKLASELDLAMGDENHGSHYKSKFDDAIDYPDHYYGDEEEEDPTYLRDLYHFADWLSDSNNIPDRDGESYAENIRAYALSIKQYLTYNTQKCIIIHKEASARTKSEGLSIYLPNESEWHDYKESYEELDWAEDTYWNEMLDTKYPE